MDVCILQSYLSGTCHGFALHDLSVGLLVVLFSRCFGLFGSVGHKKSSIFVFPAFGRLVHTTVRFLPVRRCWSYDQLLCFRPFGRMLALVSLLGCVRSYSAFVVSQHLCSCLHMLLAGFDMFFKTASDQPTCFSWLQTDSAEEIVSSSCSPSHTAPATSPTP